MEVNGHVPERRASASPGELMPGTWLKAVPGTGVRQEEKRHHSPMLPVVTKCTVLPSLYEHCPRLQAKSETSPESVSLLQFYLSSSHQTSCHWIVFQNCLLKSFRVVPALFIMEVVPAPQKCSRSLLNFHAAQTVAIKKINRPSFRHMGPPFKKQQQKNLYTDKEKCLLSQRS